MPTASIPLARTCLYTSPRTCHFSHMERIMPGAKITKAKDAPIKKLGHTVGTKYGTDPLAKERGASNPTEIRFDK